MRLLFFFMVLLMAFPFALSQGLTSNQVLPDLVVLKSNWARRSIPLGWDRPLYSAALEVRPVDGLPSYQRPITADSFGNLSRIGPPIRDYEYTARVKNTGSKAIVAAIWEYIFIDKGTEKELDRHQFYIMKKIKPGKEATLAGNSVSPPTKVVSAAALGKDAKQPYIEQVAMKCIAYSDGTVWKEPGFTIDCMPRRRRK